MEPIDKMPLKAEIRRKLQHMAGRQWGGYLTPTEIKHVLTMGGKSTDRDAERRMRLDYQDGVSNARWFYFEIN